MIERTIYEQPTNELMRICLRLEHLFNQAAHHLQDHTRPGNRAVLAALADILNVLDRPDAKTKFTKELTRHLTNFSRLEQEPGIDKQRLAGVIIELENLLDIMHSTAGKIGQEMRDSEFLSSIRQHLNNPGGACSFDLPLFHHWLQLSAAQRTEHLSAWLNNFDTLHAAVALLLQLTRQSQNPQPKLAEAGFFQASLDPQLPCQLIQVVLPHHSSVYPEISVGRHGVFIRFFCADIFERPIQTTEDIEFKLNTCIL